MLILGGGNEEQKPEELNKRALAIIQRVKDKLTGISHVSCMNSMVTIILALSKCNHNICLSDHWNDTQICDWTWEKPASTHNYECLEILILKLYFSNAVPHTPVGICSCHQ